MKIGLLGGTFDPIHNGHLALALAAKRELKLNKVYFVVSPCSPFKQHRKKTDESVRLQMVRLAVKGRSGFAAAKWEFDRRGPSYTIDTIKEYQARYPQHALFLILGSDALRGFPRWKEPNEILKRTTLVVGRRPGSEMPRCLPGVAVLSGLFPDISATKLRAAFAKKTQQRALVPLAVRTFIQRRKLYSSPHAG